VGHVQVRRRGQGDKVKEISGVRFPSQRNGLAVQKDENRRFVSG